MDRRNLLAGMSATTLHGNFPDILSKFISSYAGVAHRIGSLEVGKLADLVVLNRRLEVKHVFLCGKRFLA